MVRLNGLTVLVVDDVPDSGDLVTAFLKRRGADVIQCGSTAAALSALATTAVDLIVADLGMPDVDGFRMIEQVRAKPPGHHHIPAVAVSALARPEDRDKALAAGYDGYCAKPIELTEFLETIEGVLKRHSETAAGRTA